MNAGSGPAALSAARLDGPESDSGSSRTLPARHTPLPHIARARCARAQLQLLPCSAALLP